MVQVFYDMNCSLCSNIINKLRKSNSNYKIDFYDRSELNVFIKNKNDQEFIKEVDSIILVENSEIRYYSDAVMRLFMLTGGIFRILAFFLVVVPRFIRDIGYKVIARYRHRLKCHVSK